MRKILITILNNNILQPFILFELLINNSNITQQAIKYEKPIVCCIYNIENQLFFQCCWAIHRYSVQKKQVGQIFLLQ